MKLYYKFILILLVFFSLGKVANAQCTGTPNAGSIPLVLQYCILHPDTIKLTGCSTGPGITYEWWWSPNGVNWSMDSTITPFHLLDSITQLYHPIHYYCNVKCLNGGGSPNFARTTVCTVLGIKTYLNVGICQGNSYFFNNKFLTVQGLYYDTLNSQYGCDSIVQLALYYYPTTPITTINQTICNTQSYFFKNQNLNTSGTYYDTLVNRYGCDSIIQLTLWVMNPILTPVNQTICSNSYYYFNGQYLTTPGVYYDTLIVNSGCNLIYTLNLSVNQISNTFINQTICNNQPYFFNGNNLATSGTYYDTLTNYLGCDSIITLNLTFANPSSSIIYDTICTSDSLVLSNGAFHLPGIYYDTLVNYIGCDSMVTHYLDTLNCNCKVDFYGFVSYTPNFNLKVVFLTSGAINPANTFPFRFSQSYTNSSGYHTIINTMQSSGNVLFSPINPLSGINSNTSVKVKCKSGGTAISFVQLYCSGKPSIGKVKFSQKHICAPFKDTISVVKAGIGINYRWYKNGLLLPNDTLSFLIDSTLITSANYYCIAICAISGISDTSNIDTISVLNSFVTLYQPLCAGNSYFFNGNNLTSSGTYLDTLKNQYGCDSIVTLILTANISSGSSINQAICGNQSYYFHSQNLIASGTYYDTLTNYLGCDSIITLNLTVNPISNYVINQSICSGSSYFFNGNNLITSVTYLDTLTNFLGCDSIITLNLIVIPISSSSINQTVCNNYFFNNQTLTASGIYYDTLTNYLGCDSIITLNLNIKSISNFTITQTICSNQTYFFGGNNLNFNGVYLDTLTNYIGCDSIITLNLIVNPSPTIISKANYQSCFYPTICASLNMNANNGVPPYIFNASSLHGGAYNSTNQTICYANVQQDTITVIVTDANGCTSLVTDTIKLSTDCVWPGDANSDLVADNLDIFPIGLLNGTTGPVRNNASLIWIDQPAIAYGISALGFTNDAKHADCNGDGIIDGNDTTAILQNYGLTHLRRKSGADLMSLTVGPDTLYQNTTATVLINLGKNGIPIDSVYGVAFSFNVDPTAIDTNSIQINAPSSWLFNNANDHFQIYKLTKSATRVDVGLVRNNHLSKSGFGTIVSVTIDITTGNIIGREDALAAYNKKYQLHCSVDNITILKLDGSTVSANMAQDSSLILYNKPDGINSIKSQNLSHSIIPNPATNNALIKLLGYNYNEEKKLILIDATGRIILQKSFTGNQTSLDVSALNQGIYIVKIISEKGTTEGKMIKQ